MSRLERLTALHRGLASEVTATFDAAWAVEDPAGSSEGWREVLARHGVEPIGEAERDQIRSAQRPTRGAPVMELSAVLEQIARAVRVSARRIDPPLDDREATRMSERLLRLVERVPAEVSAAYRNAVLPRRGGMFQNVLAHHDASRRPATETAGAHSLRCKTCGAPRMKSDDFRCVFCDGPMV